MTQQVTTSSGFQCDIDTEVLDDMEILELLIEVDEHPKNSLLYFSKITKKMMDEDTKNRLYDHIRDENGRVPATKFATEFNEIFKELKDGKKS